MLAIQEIFLDPLTSSSIVPFYFIDQSFSAAQKPQPENLWIVVDLDLYSFYNFRSVNG